MIFPNPKFRLLYLFSPLLIFVMFFSCREKASEDKLVQFEEKKLEKETCHKGACARVSLTYPLFLGDQESVRFLNVHVEQQLVMFLNIGEDQQIAPLDSAIAKLFEAFIDFKNEFDSPQEWEISIDSHVSFQNEKLISVVFNTFSFTGGAHPNSYRLYLNYEKAQNSPLKNESLIADKKALLVKTEEKFRKYFELEEGMELRDDDRFFLENDSSFFLPAAMGFEDEDFVLYYNPYEIGPYVLGATELRFSKEEIKGLVKIP